MSLHHTAPHINPIVDRDRYDILKGSVRFFPDGARYRLTVAQMEQLATDLMIVVDDLRAESNAYCLDIER